MAFLSSKPLIVLYLALTTAGGGWMYAARQRPPTPESIAQGRQLFTHEWQVNDSLGGGDGLGPVFNARSCVACHFQAGVGGGGSNEFNVMSFIVAPRPFDKAMHGGVVHAMATLPEFEESTDSVQKKFPIIRNVPLNTNGCRSFGDVNPVHYEKVNTPALFGLGLLDDISAHHLHVNGAKRTWSNSAKAMENEFDVIPVGRLRPVNGNKIGRFGWKGQFGSLRDFVAAACAVELGVSNPYRKQDLPRQHEEHEDAELDLNRDQFDALVDFVKTLPRPRQVLPNPQVAEQAARGEQVFHDVGCAICHTPDIGDVAGVYSDFRLYDLTSEGSYDNSPFNKEIPRDQPQLGDWKTPPLWGVADSAPYFHDGRSATLEYAILRHNGDARRSLAAFKGATREDQAALLTFLRTLRAPAGDSHATTGALVSGADPGRNVE